MKNGYSILLIKALVFVVFFFLIDFLIGLGFKHLRGIAYEKNKLSIEMSSVYCIEDATPDIAIFGSSTASHHYIPSQIEDSLNMSVYNFARDGHFFLFQNALINLMIDRYSPKVIIWEIGESSLSNSHDAYEFQSINDLYPWYNNPYVSSVIDEQGFFQRYKMIISCYRENSTLLSLLRMSFISNNDNRLGYVPLEKTTFVSVEDEDYEKCKINDDKVERLRHTISRCKQKGIKLIFTSSPRFYDNKVLNTPFYSLLVNIADSSKVPIINFYNLEPFHSDSSLFKDNSHLNHEGAEMYMDLFIPELKKVLSL